MDNISETLPTLPFEQRDPLQLPPLLRSLQEQASITRVRTTAGDLAWLVARYDEVGLLLADKRLGRSHPEPERAARYNLTAFLGGPVGNHETEAADHARFRALLSPHFTLSRMRRLRPRLERIADERLSAFAHSGPPADIHSELSMPFAGQVISTLLGVPPDEQQQFQQWTRAIAGDGEPELSHTAMAEIFAYAKDLTARKRAHPDESVTSALCQAEEASLEDDEVAFLTAALLFAGYETTVDSIDRGTTILMTHPKQAQILRDNPERLPAAVEEVLRMSIGGAAPRYAKTDIQIDGTTIHQGDLVLLDPNTADHDPRVFANPDDFDIDRPQNPHLAFGHGHRYCIGAPLARIEMHIIFRRILQSFPTMRLATEPADLKRNSTNPVSGFTDLIVTW